MRVATPRARAHVPHHAGADVAAWSRPLAAAGFTSRAVVYLVLAGLTVDIAITGGTPAPTSSVGAFAEVDRQPGGPLLLGALALGLLAYALWRLVLVAVPSASKARDAWARIGQVVIALVYLALLAEAVGVLVGHAGAGGPSSHPRPYAATALSWPGGPLWVALAGAVVVVAGVALGVWGVAHDYRGDLSGAPRRAVTVTTWCGALGNLVRGALAALVGAYLLEAAVTDRPGQVKTLDAALLAVAHSGVGPPLLGLAAAGLASFAALSVLEARYRRV